MPFNPETPNFADLRSCIARGSCVAFVGAGLSAPTCVLWGQFVARLLAILPESERPGPDDRTEAFYKSVATKARQLRPAELDSLIRELFAHEIPTPAYTPLSNCGFKHFVTTNYDPFLHKSLSPEARTGVKLHSYPELFAPNLQLSRTCIYLHGQVANEGQSHRIVLDDNDYQQAYDNPGTARDMLTQIVQQYSICFIGTSLEEPIARCMERMQIMREAARKAYPQALEWYKVIRCASDQHVVETVQQQKEKGFQAVCYIGQGDDHSQLHALLSALAGQTGLVPAPPYGFLEAQKPSGGVYDPRR